MVMPESKELTEAIASLDDLLDPDWTDRTLYQLKSEVKPKLAYGYLIDFGDFFDSPLDVPESEHYADIAFKVNDQVYECSAESFKLFLTEWCEKGPNER
jgi:hypothetical protein